MYKEFIPKIYTCLTSNYTLPTLKKDLLAGITVGVVAFPLAIAFAIASGVSPTQGLITAIIAGFCISAFGGSRVQIGGPTGAFVVLVYDIMQRTGYEGLAISTLIAAFCLILLGVFRIGSWIKYIPHSLITGFTSGIALLIFTSQIKDFLGLSHCVMPVSFTGKWSLYFSSISSCQLLTVACGVGTILMILLLRLWAPKAPWAITSIAAATAVCYFCSLPIETIASRFSHISSSIPWPAFPDISPLFHNKAEIFLDGIAIALLGGIESLLSAVIGDGMVGGRHRSNCELIGQGVANFFSVLFGGIPATGAIARTATNVKSGAKTPVAGVVHCVTLLLIVLFCSSFVNHIPLAALSSVLIVIAWNMSEYKHFVSLLRAPFSDVAILLSSFFLTVFVDIVAAICFGVVLASLFFMKRMSELSKTVPVRWESTVESRLPSIPDGVEVYEIQGPFFFGAANMLQDILLSTQKTPKYFILRMQNTSYIDASGMQALREFYQKCTAHHISLFLSELPEKAKKDLRKFGFFSLLHTSHCFPTLEEALSKVK